jgi:hypothetical protein
MIDGCSPVSVIDLNSRKMIASVDLGGPARPHCAIVCSKDGRLYVTAELTRSIKVIVLPSLPGLPTPESPYMGTEALWPSGDTATS